MLMAASQNGRGLSDDGPDEPSEAEIFEKQIPGMPPNERVAAENKKQKKLHKRMDG
jgi:hypothetical protein